MEDSLIIDKTEVDELTANDIPDQITKILDYSTVGNMSRYQVLWQSGEKSWVEESDMNCPELLVSFIKTQSKKQKGSHKLLQSLIEALEGVLTQIQNPKCKLTDMGIKKKIKEFIGRGNPYLKSSRVVTKLENELQQVSTKEQLILLLYRWTTDSNDTFAGEWDQG